MDKRIFGTALSAALAMAVAGCGATAPRTGAMADETTQQEEWTSALLRKLAPDLRARVRGDDMSAVAVQVTFRRIPDEDELADLMLNRVGGQVIGRVQVATLRTIAARADVERVEPLRDVGY
ncbi:MAG: hypothetical protein RLO52_32320 [Sandaracinaceae bacterium]